MNVRRLVAAMVLLMSGGAAGQDGSAGERVYLAQKCAICHQIEGNGNPLSVLDGVGTRLSVDQIREWIVNPEAAAEKQASTKQPPMPRLYARLPPPDIDLLVAYLQSLK